MEAAESGMLPVVAGKVGAHQIRDKRAGLRHPCLGHIASSVCSCVLDCKMGVVMEASLWSCAA